MTFTCHACGAAATFAAPHAVQQSYAAGWRVVDHHAHLVYACPQHASATPWQEDVVDAATAASTEARRIATLREQVREAQRNG